MKITILGIATLLLVAVSSARGAALDLTIDAGHAAEKVGTTIAKNHIRGTNTGVWDEA